MKTFYLSFTGTIGLLCRGKLKWEALDEGLFYFGCNKAHAMWADKERDGVDEWIWVANDKLTTPEVDALKERWKVAMEKAEAEGRFLCRKSDDGYSETDWSALVALGEQHGALIMPPVDKDKWEEDEMRFEAGLYQLPVWKDYCYPTAKEAIEASGHVAVY